MAIDAISYLYAATVAAGGIIGYVKAGKFALIQKYFNFVLKRQVKLKMIKKNVFQVRFHHSVLVWLLVLFLVIFQLKLHFVIFLLS